MKWKKYLPLIGIFLFIYILFKLNISEIYNEFKQLSSFNWVFIFLLFFIFIFIGLGMQTFKWFIIARTQKIKIPFKEAYKINFLSNFYGFITPSRLGTVIRADYLKKYTDNIGKGLCNFTLDKILDLSSLLFLTILFLFIFQEKFSFLPINLFMILFILLVFSTIFFVGKSRSKFILRFFYRKFVPLKMKERLRLTFDSFYDNIPKKRYFILFFIFNLITWIIFYTIAFYIGRFLGIELPFFYFLAILPIGTLISMIPISINGLGTREAALISLFSLFGISATKVFSMSLINLFITGIIPSIITIFLIFKIKQ